ncbi:MAG: hypothetical protein LCH74_03625 [Proteobacteria bacterium]|nr:hypothetical protein [Pseudomonadota bacterium]
MAALPMIITDAGWDAIVDAQNGGTDAVEITELGLTATPFVMAPTLTALPGEFRRIDTVAGQAVSESIIHIVAHDPAAIVYNVTGFGLFASDGTLIAVYSAVADPILSKAQLATSLFALDIAFGNGVAAVIEFGDALFLNPPASHTVAGVAKLADDATVDAGDDDETIITPKQLDRMLKALMPRGIVTEWWGSLPDIPVGWLLCNGANGTPDLRDRFIVGAGGAYDVGDTGGSVEHGHPGSAVAAHVLTEAQMPGHRHLTTVAAVGSGALTAANSIFEASNSGGDSEYSLDGTVAEPTIGRTSSTGGGAAHDHGLTIDAADSRPPYFALAFIMKA